MKKILPLSVIICTYNRACLLGKTLDSLSRQTLPRNKFEVVIIDDGSTDNTVETVQKFCDLLTIKYFYQKNAGLASARNHGIFAAVGEIILFFDDDDIATETLLEEHLKTHRQYPGQNFAVLHRTTWDPELTVTPLMHFISDIGCFLFAYPYIKHGDVLHYEYFWGGRTSCKKSLLLDFGIFNPIFKFGNEDTELGYRLSHYDLKVVYNAKAVAYMTRPIDFDSFCLRLIKQGRSNYVCSRIHPEPEVQKWCEVNGMFERWSTVKPRYEMILRSARELDKIANIREVTGMPLDENTLRLLHQAYWQAFHVCKLKGIISESEKNARGSKRSETSTVPGQYKGDFTVVAILCVYNEGDIIYHTLKHLIENGIRVYLLDHNSTDNTVEEASKWFGKGLLHIEKFPQESGFSEELVNVFALRVITQRVAQLHSTLNASWYLHYDADEFREAPWPGMTLKEAIMLVDSLGYNAINFELFNFRPTDNSYQPGEDIRKYLKYYEPAEEFDVMQTKAWKNMGQTIDLSSTAGHMVSFVGRKIFPVHFITLHFPVRSQDHGMKKILKERTSRFDSKEKALGWHRQYKTFLEKEPKFIYNKDQLTLYDPDKARLKLWTNSVLKLDS